ncbi:MAG TPA: hypothetical protein VFZ30_12930 [Acidimicrobiales bacterium]|jgi:hypothetical protein
MSLLHEQHRPDRPDLEDGVRTMLHRLATGATERPPAWDELVARREAVVVPLGVTDAITEARVHRLGPKRRPRMSLAAAAVLLVAIAGALVIDRTGSEPTGGPTADTISVISPGDPSFDAGAAAAFWATDTADPVAATMAYLGAMGVPTDAAVAPAAVLRSATDATAVVDWSLPAAVGSSSGTVYLRSTPVAGAVPTWSVVGAAASDVALADVRYDGAELSFTVARTSAQAEQLAVSVWVDGQPVSLGGDAVAQAGAGDVSLGELVDIGTGADAHDTLQLPVEADDIVTLRVVHVVDGMVRSVAQMAVALPDAASAVAAAAGSPSVAGGGQPSGQVDAGTDRASGSESGDVEAGGSGGIDLVPGGTVPTLPELPPLAPLPSAPSVPAPTVPAPPVTALESPSDLLP